MFIGIDYLSLRESCYEFRMISRISMLLPTFVHCTLLKDVKFYYNQQRRRCFRRCTCRYLTMCMLLFILLVITVTVQIYRYHTSCSDNGSRLYLEQLCKNYSEGLITGSFCSSLCDTHDVEFEKCLGHGIKLHVLKIKWRGKPVILKTSKPLGTRSLRKLSFFFSKPLNHNFKITRQEFIESANQSVFHNIAGETHTSRTIEVLDEIFTECDVGGDGTLLLLEAIVCWELLETDEYMLNLMLKGSSPTLDVYGTCGNMYSIEYADAGPFMAYKTSLSETRAWSLRARLAVAILELIESFEHTPYGTLYLCDVQEANFGIVTKSDGQLAAKAIDLDISMFKSSLLSALKHRPYVNGGTCSKDRDCNFNFINCLGECDLTTQSCTGRLKSNNLITICRDLFTKMHPLHPYLMSNPPTIIAEPLERLLKECSRPGPSQIDWDLFNELKSLLISSIQNNN